MASEFWQRLRAARTSLNLTQAAMARHLGVTRSGYAFYEERSDSRVRPNIEQLKAMADVLRVPVEWLLNDNADANDIWQYRIPGARPAVVVTVGATTPAPAPTSRLEETFWRAAEYQVIAAEHSRAHAFGVPLATGSVKVTADYLSDRTLVQFSKWGGLASLVDQLGRLFLTEAASRKKLQKHLLLWAPDTADLGDLCEELQATFGVACTRVSSAEQVSQYVLAH